MSHRKHHYQKTSSALCRVAILPALQHLHNALAMPLLLQLYNTGPSSSYRSDRSVSDHLETNNLGKQFMRCVGSIDSSHSMHSAASPSLPTGALDTERIALGDILTILVYRAKNWTSALSTHIYMPNAT